MRRFGKWLLNLFPSIEELRNNWSALLVCACTGLLMRLPYPKLNWWWVAWIGLIPFFFELRWSRPRRVIFYMGWVFGFTFYYSNVAWLNVLISYNPLVPVGIICLGLVLGIFMAVFAVASTAITRRLPWMAFILVPALWTVLEYFRSVGQMVFPWTYLATSQYYFTPIIQICDVTGVWGLSFLIVLVNWSIARVMPPLHDFKKGEWIRRVVPVVVSLGLLVGSLTYGISALKREYGNGETMKVALIQPSIPQKKKFKSYTSSDGDEQRRLQTEINKDALNRIEALDKSDLDLVILPESVFPSLNFNLNKTLIKQLKRISHESNVPLLFGACEIHITSPDGLPTEQWVQGSTYSIYNCAWLISNDPAATNEIEIYRKMLLVPFGETVPYLDVIPGFQKYVVGVGSFARGMRYNIFNTGGVKFNSVICFESAFPAFFGAFNRRGAQFNVVLTNDGWYGTSAGPYQHLVLSGFRAVEGRRTVVRAANNGISAVFDPKGRIVRELALDEKGSIVSDITLNSEITFYHHFGEWFAWLCILLVLAGGAATWILGRKEKAAARVKD